LSNPLRVIGRELLGLLGRPEQKPDDRPGPSMLGYAILVGEELHNYIRRLQLEILGKYGRYADVEVSPHITLKQAFPMREIQPFEQHFDTLVAETEPFEITVRDIGFFDDGVVFLDVVQTPSLDSLRKRIVQDLSSGFGVKPYALEDDRYHFHATLARGLPRDSFERARQSLTGRRVEFRFVCDTLALLCRAGGVWITYKRSALGPTRHR
jgi:2'-5' RNA ligase